jgi:hypothetical protein
MHQDLRGDPAVRVVFDAHPPRCGLTPASLATQVRRQQVREEIGRVGTIGDAADRAHRHESLVVGSGRRSLAELVNGRLKVFEAGGF